LLLKRSQKLVLLSPGGGYAELLWAGVASTHCDEKDAASVKINFESVWTKVVEQEGQTFIQLRGKRFTYEVRPNSLCLSTTNQSITRSELETAFEVMPLQSPSQSQHVRAPSYQYAILMNPRIRVLG
jgi:hypothetical protein